MGVFLGGATFWWVLASFLHHDEGHPLSGGLKGNNRNHVLTLITPRKRQNKKTPDLGGSDSNPQTHIFKPRSMGSHVFSARAVPPESWLCYQ